MTELNDIPQALYKIVSGKAGEKRNWQLLKDLHTSNARISPIFHDESGHSIKTFTVNEFIELNQQVFKDVDFFETEVKAKVFRFGNSATIISQYESRTSPTSAPYSTGVNSFQLVNDGNGWCVISVIWDSDKGQYPTEDFQLE